jgi:hypothetical protein
VVAGSVLGEPEDRKAGGHKGLDPLLEARVFQVITKNEDRRVVRVVPASSGVIGEDAM